MTPRRMALVIGIAWLVTVVLLMHHLGCSPSSPC